jgi:hypothetical protein
MDIKKSQSKPLKKDTSQSSSLISMPFLIVFLARGSIPVVEHFNHHPKVKGSSIPANKGAERENDRKMY